MIGAGIAYEGAPHLVAYILIVFGALLLWAGLVGKPTQFAEFMADGAKVWIVIPLEVFVIEWARILVDIMAQDPDSWFAGLYGYAGALVVPLSFLSILTYEVVNAIRKHKKVRASKAKTGTATNNTKEAIMRTDIRDLLIQAAKAGEVVYYMGLGLARGKALGQALAEIADYEREAGRPMLTAVAVSKTKGMPNEGFWALPNVPRLNDHQRPLYWAREFVKVVDYWQKQP